MTAESLGARVVEEVVADITSLTNAGNEPLSTWTDQSEIDVVDNFQVVGQEEDDQVCIPDHINDQVHVVTVSDGTDVNSGVDIGEVRLRLEGRR